jgi:hypothetical protein
MAAGTCPHTSPLCTRSNLGTGSLVPTPGTRLGSCILGCRRCGRSGARRRCRRSCMAVALGGVVVLVVVLVLAEEPVGELGAVTEAAVTEAAVAVAALAAALPVEVGPHRAEEPHRALGPAAAWLRLGRRRPGSAAGRRRHPQRCQGRCWSARRTRERPLAGRGRPPVQRPRCRRTSIRSKSDRSCTGEARRRPQRAPAPPEGRVCYRWPRPHTIPENRFLGGPGFGLIRSRPGTGSASATPPRTGSSAAREAAGAC